MGLLKTTCRMMELEVVLLVMPSSTLMMELSFLGAKSDFIGNKTLTVMHNLLITT